MALEVGKTFYVEKKVNAYNTLGIGRLIYQLPINLCRIFIEEIFGENDILDSIDEETLNTINKFFENNLNVSETSRQLFIHRNTLVYRIEKLERSTGLDIRKFDDALTFKIALMVANYMKYLDTHEY
jgi:carbohydrate diacid regulator